MKRDGLSLIIPVYNEESILNGVIENLIQQLPGIIETFEIILVENGSSDQTLNIAEKLAENNKFIVVFHLPSGDYGKALRTGIIHARYDFIICDEIDICNTDFYPKAISLLMEYDMVIASKRHPHSKDNRPFIRRFATKTVNFLLRVLFNLKSTDTHGVKAFRKNKIIAILHQCQLNKDLFASELVIRSEQQKLKILEIPISLQEIRPPSTHIFQRIPKTMLDLLKLFYFIRIKKI